LEKTRTPLGVRLDHAIDEAKGVSSRSSLVRIL